MAKCMSLSTSMYSFIWITIPQIVLFIFKPTLFGALVEKSPEYLQIIGIKEISLMLLYYNIIQEKSSDLALMTVFGRICTIPLILFMVFILKGPTDLLGGIVLDIVFGTWTLMAWATDTEWTSDRGSAGKYKRSVMSFLILASIGGVECYSGVLMFFKPSQIIGNRMLLPLPDPQTEAPHFPLRSFGLMTMLVGCYQVILALQPALTPRMWSAITRFHVLFALLLPTFSYILQKPHNLSFEIPLLHMAAGGLLASYNAVRTSPSLPEPVASGVPQDADSSADEESDASEHDHAKQE